MSNYNYKYKYKNFKKEKNTYNCENTENEYSAARKKYINDSGCCCSAIEETENGYEEVDNSMYKMFYEGPSLVKKLK